MLLHNDIIRWKDTVLDIVRFLYSDKGDIWKVKLTLRLNTEVNSDFKIHQRTNNTDQKLRFQVSYNF